MLQRALLVMLVCVAIISLVVYQAVISPQTQREMDTAINLAVKELELRLNSKQDSAITMAASLARDDRIRRGLVEKNRALMVDGIRNVREDYAQITHYQSISAQVIDADRVIQARSWDLNFHGEKAPHPLGVMVLEKNRAMARFGMGNAGTGVIAFAPINVNNRLLGLISITQGVLSVVHELQQKEIDWVMVVDEKGLASRYNGKIPAQYKDVPILHPGHLLAHATWFDPTVAEWVKEHWGAIMQTPGVHRVDDRVVLVLPVLDEANVLIGRHVLMIDAQPVMDRISAASRYLLWVNAGLVLVSLAMAAVLLWDMRFRVIDPLREMTRTMQNTLSSGRFEPLTTGLSADEIGKAQESFNALMSKLNQGIEGANTAVREAAKGNFDTTMPGEFVGDLATLQTGIQAAIADLRTTHENLVQSNKAKGMFLANMSHEIRTPMNAVIGMAYLALKTDLNDEQREYVNRIHVAANSLLGILNDILDFSKIEAGKLSLETVPFRVEDVVANTMVMVRQSALDKGIELLLDVKARELMHRAGVFQGDPLRLGQVLTNLLSNAVKFTAHGHVKLTVNVTSHPDVSPAQLLFVVEDTGIGMTTDQVSHLFEEFTQADGSTTRRFGGTGLGLTITRRLLDLMHGDIDVVSHLGVGTRFMVQLPLPVVSGAAAELPATPIGRCLVIDNLEPARAVLTDMLHNLGAQEVVQVSDANRGLVALAQPPGFSHCFVDWMMPEMDGEAFLRAATAWSKETGHPLPEMVVVSAHDADNLAPLALQLGATRVLSKPVLPEHLRTVMRLQRQNASAASSSASAEQINLLTGMAVLLVEDNRVNQILARKLLETQGAKVDICTNGQEALDQLQQLGSSHYDVVLMDLQMPVMDGYTATQRLRADRQFDALPIIAMTAHAMVEEVERCAALGMNEHLTKPIHPPTLYGTLAKYKKT